MTKVGAFAVIGWLFGIVIASAATLEKSPDGVLGGIPLESADTVWDAIATARVEINTNTGSWHLVDSPLTRSLLGRQVTLYGSVQVQDPSSNPKWFIFLRSMSECGACDLGDPTKVVKVMGANLSPKIGDVVTATGRFVIGVDKNIGVVFQLQDAKVALR